MAEENNAGGSGAGFTQPPPSDDRRNRPKEEDERSVVFVERKIGQEKLDSLKAFLKTATADDIATVRKMYGDNLEVLKLIGLEFHDGQDSV